MVSHIIWLFAFRRRSVRKIRWSDGTEKQLRLVGKVTFESDRRVTFESGDETPSRWPIFLVNFDLITFWWVSMHLYYVIKLIQAHREQPINNYNILYCMSICSPVTLMCIVYLQTGVSPLVVYCCGQPPSQSQWRPFIVDLLLCFVACDTTDRVQGC